MNLKRLVVATLAVGVVGNALDFLVHGTLLKGYYAGLATLFRQDTPMQWLVIGDFVAALVFVWFYSRVYGSFGGGAKGGATYGLCAGILVSFPAQIFNYLLIADFPYSLAWIWIAAGVAWGLVAGVVAGLTYKP
jgi:hypothetical protein